jgi:hypothetical protein
LSDGRAAAFPEHALRRPSDLIRKRAVGQRLGEMHAADFFRAVEVGERARNAEYAVIAARREPYRIDCFTQAA